MAGSNIKKKNKFCIDNLGIAKIHYTVIIMIIQVQAYNARTQQWSVEEPLTSPRHKACAVGIDDFIVITGGTMLGLGKHKPSWLAEIGTR